MTAVELLKRISEQGFNEQLQQQVVALDDAELAYRFAHDLPEADLELLESIVINANQPRIAYEFALIKAERGGVIEQLQETVIDSNDGGLMILFAADVNGADLELLEDAIRRHPDTKYLQLFEAEMRQKGFY